MERKRIIRKTTIMTKEGIHFLTPLSERGIKGH
jgi:hypothetical protein